MEDPLDALIRPEYPRSSTYDRRWLVESDMGPHPLWLLEDLARDLDIRPGARVLDLGSGKGATSVFLAREYRARVWAADLWVPPDEAAAAFRAQGVADRVTAVRAEAHALPFARESFDAIVCVDAYEYFGTADSYLPYLVGFLKPRGQLGVATPALRREVRDIGHIPAHIKACVGWEAMAWHTADWWRFQWETTELVTVVAARLQESGWHDWLTWSRVTAAYSGQPNSSIDMLEADGGELLTFALLAAVKR